MRADLRRRKEFSLYLKLRRNCCCSHENNFLSLPTQVRDPGIVDMVGVCKEKGTSSGAKHQGHQWDKHTLPIARAVLLLSGCPHGCWSLLRDNPLLLLGTLQVKTLSTSACVMGLPCVADLGFCCQLSPLVPSPLSWSLQILFSCFVLSFFLLFFPPSATRSQVV